MNILFVHHNIPAQFKQYINYFLKNNHNVVFICDRPAFGPTKIQKNYYVFGNNFKKDVSGSFESMHQCSLRFRVTLLKFKKEYSGTHIDLIFCHSGWGAGVYLRELFPAVKIISYLEWWFSHLDPSLSYTDANYDWLPPITDKFVFSQQSRNFTQSLEIINSDYVVSPTIYQASFMPEDFRHKTSIVRDAVDVAKIEKYAFPPTVNMPHFSVSYSARGLEAMRGFPEFVLGAVQALKRRRSINFHVIGANKSFYMGKPKHIKSFGDWAMEYIRDNGFVDNFHFYGRLPYKKYINILSSTNAHLYFTRPFVPGWGLLEAMTLSKPLITSTLPPTRELCSPSATFWVDHLDIQEVCNKIIVLNDLFCEDPQFCQTYGLPQKNAIIENHSVAKFEVNLQKILSKL